MTLSTKAIFAALVLSLSPALASAQSVGNFGPNTPQINGVAISTGVQYGTQAVPGQFQSGVPPQAGVPAQTTECGAQQYQGFVGQSVEAMRSNGITARYFTPDSPYGSLDYQPHRLNVSTDTNYVINRIYCG